MIKVVVVILTVVLASQLLHRGGCHDASSNGTPINPDDLRSDMKLNIALAQDLVAKGEKGEKPTFFPLYYTTRGSVLHGNERERVLSIMHMFREWLKGLLLSAGFKDIDGQLDVNFNDTVPLFKSSLSVEDFQNWVSYEKGRYAQNMIMNDFYGNTTYEKESLGWTFALVLITTGDIKNATYIGQATGSGSPRSGGRCISYDIISKVRQKDGSVLETTPGYKRELGTEGIVVSTAYHELAHTLGITHIGNLPAETEPFYSKAGRVDGKFLEQKKFRDYAVMMYGIFGSPTPVANGHNTLTHASLLRISMIRLLSGLKHKRCGCAVEAAMTTVDVSKSPPTLSVVVKVDYDKSYAGNDRPAFLIPYISWSGYKHPGFMDYSYPGRFYEDVSSSGNNDKPGPPSYSNPVFFKATAPVFMYKGGTNKYGGFLILCETGDVQWNNGKFYLDWNYSPVPSHPVRISGVYYDKDHPFPLNNPVNPSLGTNPTFPSAPKITPPRVAGQKNVALGKSTAQSSTQYSGFSDRAVDGNEDSWYSKGSCISTVYGTKNKPSWWRVDLGRVYKVKDLSIYYRQIHAADLGKDLSTITSSLKGARVLLSLNRENAKEPLPLDTIIGTSSESSSSSLSLCGAIPTANISSNEDSISIECQENAFATHIYIVHEWPIVHSDPYNVLSFCEVNVNGQVCDCDCAEDLGLSIETHCYEKIHPRVELPKDVFSRNVAVMRPTRQSDPPEFLFKGDNSNKQQVETVSTESSNNNTSQDFVVTTSSIGFAAVDGNTDEFLSHGSCIQTATQYGGYPTFWMVDLDRTKLHLIRNITIFHRRKPVFPFQAIATNSESEHSLISSFSPSMIRISDHNDIFGTDRRVPEYPVESMQLCSLPDNSEERMLSEFASTSVFKCGENGLLGTHVWIVDLNGEPFSFCEVVVEAEECACVFRDREISAIRTVQREVYEANVDVSSGLEMTNHVVKNQSMMTSATSSSSHHESTATVAALGSIVSTTAGHEEKSNTSSVEDTTGGNNSSTTTDDTTIIISSTTTSAPPVEAIINTTIEEATTLVPPARRRQLNDVGAEITTLRLKQAFNITVIELVRKDEASVITTAECDQECIAAIYNSMKVFVSTMEDDYDSEDDFCGNFSRVVLLNTDDDDDTSASSDTKKNENTVLVHAVRCPSAHLGSSIYIVHHGWPKGSTADFITAHTLRVFARTRVVCGDCAIRNASAVPQLPPDPFLDASKNNEASDTNGNDASSSIAEGCGNNIKQESEQCDDGNHISGDGCSRVCTIEDGFQCPVNKLLKSVCSRTHGTSSDSVSDSYLGKISVSCGNGLLQCTAIRSDSRVHLSMDWKVKPSSGEEKNLAYGFKRIPVEDGTACDDLAIVVDSPYFTAATLRAVRKRNAASSITMVRFPPGKHLIVAVVQFTEGGQAACVDATNKRSHAFTRVVSGSSAVCPCRSITVSKAQFSTESVTQLFAVSGGEAMSVTGFASSLVAVVSTSRDKEILTKSFDVALAKAGEILAAQKESGGNVVGSTASDQRSDAIEIVAALDSAAHSHERERIQLDRSLRKQLLTTVGDLAAELAKDSKPLTAETSKSMLRVLSYGLAATGDSKASSSTAEEQQSSSAIQVDDSIITAVRSLSTALKKSLPFNANEAQPMLSYSAGNVNISMAALNPGGQEDEEFVLGSVMFPAQSLKTAIDKQQAICSDGRVFLSSVTYGMNPLLADGGAASTIGTGFAGSQFRQIELSRCDSPLEVKNLKSPFQFCVHNESPQDEWKALQKEGDKTSSKLFVATSDGINSAGERVDASGSCDCTLSEGSRRFLLDSWDVFSTDYYVSKQREWEEDEEPFEDGSMEGIWLENMPEQSRKDPEVMKMLGEAVDVGDNHSTTTTSAANVSVNGGQDTAITSNISSTRVQLRRLGLNFGMDGIGKAATFRTDRKDGTASSAVEKLRMCKFFDKSSNSWSGFGCRVSCRSKDFVVCECTHTSIFAVRLDKAELTTTSVISTDVFNSDLLNKFGFWVSILFFALLYTPYILFFIKDKKDWIRPARRTTFFFNEMALHEGSHSSGGGASIEGGEGTRKTSHAGRKSLVPFLEDRSGKTSRASSFSSQPGAGVGNQDVELDPEKDIVACSDPVHQATRQLIEETTHQLVRSASGEDINAETPGSRKNNITDSATDIRRSSANTMQIEITPDYCTTQNVAALRRKSAAHHMAYQQSLSVEKTDTADNEANNNDSEGNHHQQKDGAAASSSTNDDSEQRLAETLENNASAAIAERRRRQYPTRIMPRLLPFNAMMNRVQRYGVLSLTLIGIPVWASFFFNYSCNGFCPEADNPFLPTPDVIQVAIFSLVFALPLSICVRLLFSKKVAAQAIPSNRKTAKQLREWQVKDIIGYIILYIVHLLAIYYILHYVGMYEYPLVNRWARASIMAFVLRLVVIPLFCGLIHLIVLKTVKNPASLTTLAVFCPFIPSWGLDVLA